MKKKELKTLNLFDGPYSITATREGDSYEYAIFNDSRIIVRGSKYYKAIKDDDTFRKDVEDMFEKTIESKLREK